MPSLVAPVLTGLPTEQPCLTHEDLLLRPWQDDDAPVLLAVYADPAVRRWHTQTMDEAEARDYAALRAARWRDGLGAGWAVVRGEVVVGRVTLVRLVLDEGQAEVTYWTVPAARGTGVAPRAVEAVARWAFGYGFHRLELEHSTQNPASCRVAGKTGFTLEGTRRRAVQHLDGWHDMHLHARLAVD